MLTLNPLLVVMPAVAAGLALLGYAALLRQQRKAQQLKPKPIPVDSRKRLDPKDS